MVYFMMLGIDSMKKIIGILLLIVWMSFIFIMSSFDASESSSQSGVIVTFIGNLLNINDLDTLSFVVRKMAHCFEYFILGILVFNVFKNSKYNIILLFGLCVLYALSDEVHQIFVSGREFKLFDIFVDSMGSLMGIVFYKYLFEIFKMKKVIK